MRPKEPSLLEYVLPPGTLEYFELAEMEVEEGKEKYMGKYGFDDKYTIVLKEKSNLPLFALLKSANKRVRTKGYSKRVLEDFPIRGRKTKLKFQIRKYQIEGENKIYQRKFMISTERISMTDEFSFFFEEGN